MKQTVDFKAIEKEMKRIPQKGGFMFVSEKKGQPPMPIMAFCSADVMIRSVAAFISMNAKSLDEIKAVADCMKVTADAIVTAYEKAEQALAECGKVC